MICFPNAKINIGLHVTEKRPDGYHAIETIFYPVPLRDALEVVKSENLTFKQTGISLGIPTQDNLVMKSYNLMHSHKPLPPFSIFLKKGIPPGAGLGGGSADAAFMLMLLNEWNEQPATKSDLLKMAGSIGADCPFFIHNKPVIATGVGNVFQPIDLSLKDYSLCIVKPSMSISTKDAYSMARPKKPLFRLEKLSTIPVCEWKEALVNNFETGIFQKYPIIGEIKERLYALGAIYASMTGSGSAVFGLFQENILSATSNAYKGKALSDVSAVSYDMLTTAFPDCFIWRGMME